jgi:molybdopterin-binding protein
LKLSARNQIPARVIGVTAGEATANVELDAGGTRLVASITVEAARELGLQEGTEVLAVIKASDVIVAIADAADRRQDPTRAPPKRLPEPATATTISPLHSVK